MPTRTPIIISLCAIAAMLALTAWAWTLSPDAIVTHYGLDGRPNGSMPKPVALLLLPAIAALLTAALAILPRIEPRRSNLQASRKPFLAGWYGSIALLAVVHLSTVLTATGWEVGMPRLPLIAAAILLMVLGNFVGKSRANFFVGVRTPWSLSSNEAWEKSNRMTGHWLVATGVVTAALLLLAGVKAGIAALTIGVVISAVAGVVTSYVVWKNDPHRHSEGRETPSALE